MLKKILENYDATIELPVLWGEMDAAQHVNNAIYLRYSEAGRIAYFKTMNFEVNVAASGEASIGPILAEINCRYKMPLTFPDTISIATRVDITSVDEYSFWTEQIVVSHKYERVAAEIRAKLVSYNYSTLQKTPIPAFFRDKIIKKNS